ncbi:MAG: plasmid pRiA4b ORF-3 family protein, partial [Sphingobacteriales bacterium]
MKDLLQIKISLDESDPGIWRRVVVHRDTTFFELHHIIQVSMGWQNYHMFEFSIEGYRIG